MHQYKQGNQIHVELESNQMPASVNLRSNVAKEIVPA